MNYLKDPIQWTKEEQIQAASFIFGKESNLVSSLENGFSLSLVKRIINRKDTTWDDVFLYVAFHHLPLVDTTRSLSTGKAVEWRLSYGK